MRPRFLHPATFSLVPLVAIIATTLTPFGARTPDATTPRLSRQPAGAPATSADAVAPGGGAPSGGLIDLTVSPLPASSAEVLRERLIALDGSDVAVETAIAELLALGRLAPGDDLQGVAAIIGHLGLPEAESARATTWARAFALGRPVALEGLEVDAGDARFLDDLIAQGVDPDEAAWLLQQAAKAATAAAVTDANGPDGRERLRAAATLVAGSSSLAEHVLDAAAARALAASRADDMGAPDAVGRARPNAVGRGLVTLPGVSLRAPGVPPVGLADPNCKTCPQFDYGSFTPTTNYQTHAGTIGTGSACRIYRFLVKSGRQYRFTFCEGGGTASFDTLLDAFATSCNALGSNDDSCTTRSQLDVTSPADGYVYLSVTSKTGGGGSYTLAYKDLGTGPSGCVKCPAFDHGTFVPTTSYQVHSSSIGAGGCRIYRFNLSLGRSYRFTLCEGGGSTSFASALQTLRGTCSPGPGNSGSCGMGSQVDVGAAATGYYFVKVSGTGGTGGNFTLAYRDITNDCSVCPNFNYGRFRPKTMAQTHSATVVTNGCRTYAFDLGAGVNYHFSLCQNGGSTSFPAELALLNGACTQAASDSGSCYGAPQVDFTPGTTGTYYLRVSPQGGGGSYTLAYWSDCAWCDELTKGPFMPPCMETDTSSLTMGCTQVYAFDVVGGAEYEFSTCFPETTFDTKLTVLRSSCLLLATASNGACTPTNRARVTATVPGTGPTRIYVVVQGENGESGDYKLGYGEAADRDRDGIADCADACPDDPENCNDDDACTTETCDSMGMCVYTQVSCDDSNECTTDGPCDPVNGCPHAPVPCDDNNPCTTDTCDPATGCVHTPPPPPGTGTCANPILVPNGATFTDTRSNCGAPNNKTGTCGMSSGPDVVYRIENTTTRTVTISTCFPTTDFDTVLHIDEVSCPGSAVSCTNNQAGGCTFRSDSAGFMNVPLPPGAYYVYVDGFNGATGTYTLTITGL